jgi:hypothetical protein
VAYTEIHVQDGKGFDLRRGSLLVDTRPIIYPTPGQRERLTDTTIKFAVRKSMSFVSRRDGGIEAALCCVS